MEPYRSAWGLGKVTQVPDSNITPQSTQMMYNQKVGSWNSSGVSVRQPLLGLGDKVLSQPKSHLSNSTR